MDFNKFYGRNFGFGGVEMGWIGFGRRRIEEGKKRIRWRGENERNLGVRLFKELGKNSFT